MSVHCCLVVTCWERADLLALFCDVSLFLVTFPCDILGQVWYLIASIVSLPSFSTLMSYDKYRVFQITYHLNIIGHFVEHVGQYFIILAERCFVSE